MNGMKLKGWTSEGTDNFFKRVIINVKPSDFSCFFLLKIRNTNPKIIKSI